MDFIDKKEQLADLIENYIQDKEKKGELLSYINELSNEKEFSSRQLFSTIFLELNSHLEELKTKDLKQRMMMIRSFIE